MKSIVEGECGGSNALVGLSRGYGTSNQRVASSVNQAATSLMPSSSMGEQFANEFLSQKAQRVQAPRTFNVKELARQQSHSSSSSLANQWGNEFNQRQQNSLGSQWANQYQSARPSMENAWAVATGQGLSSNNMMQGSSSSVDSAMWSAEYLDNVETTLAKSQSEIYTDAWADAEVARETRYQDMEAEWDNIYSNQMEMMRQQFEKTSINAEYEHQSENPFLSQDGNIASGDQFMQNGDLGNAVLAYEAATQQNPQDHEAWCKLGLSLAENEQDVKAIGAFRKCLEINPRNTEAILSLSVSLANESMENDALEQLERWIVAYRGGEPLSVTRASPSYSSFLKPKPKPKPKPNPFAYRGGEPLSVTRASPSYSSFLDINMFEKVEHMYLEAASQQGAAPDATLQNALGILYNLNRNFDRAVDCLRLALSTKPEDPRLWNRLGATLANGDRTAEAVSSYREALTRYPKYVRARYNLGISCMHLQSYREAVEHFTIALELQKGEKEQSGIWNTMRSAVLRLPIGTGDDLLRALDTRDINRFKEVLARI